MVRTRIVVIKPPCRRPTESLGEQIVLDTQIRCSFTGYGFRAKSAKLREKQLTQSTMLADLCEQPVGTLQSQLKILG